MTTARPYRSRQLNIPMLQAELDRITANPERWDQGGWASLRQDIQPEEVGVSDGLAEASLPGDHDWLPVVDCRTAYCLAGGVAAHNGYTFIVPEASDLDASYVVRDTILAGRNSIRVEHGGGDPRQLASDVARLLLGLNHDEADDLFHADNTLLELWTLAEALTDGEIQLPSEIRDPQLGTFSGAERVREAVEATLGEMISDERFIAVDYAMRNLWGNY
jgi:hypothetical protein